MQKFYDTQASVIGPLYRINVFLLSLFRKQRVREEIKPRLELTNKSGATESLTNNREISRGYTITIKDVLLTIVGVYFYASCRIMLHKGTLNYYVVQQSSHTHSTRQPAEDCLLLLFAFPIYDEEEEKKSEG